MKKLTTTKSIQVGDVVLWWKSPYTVIKIINKEALLKQNFSIGTTLIGTVPLKELKLLNP